MHDWYFFAKGGKSLTRGKIKIDNKYDKAKKHYLLLIITFSQETL